MSPFALRTSPKRTFEALYRRQAADVYRYALALLGSPADAEDVTQATFLNAYRALEAGERPRNDSAWLHTIALNLCRQRFRQEASRPSQVPLAEDVADVVRDNDDGPSLEDLTRALKHLPFNQRAALVMREFAGLTPREIATALEITDSAVETLMFRARRSLREQLEGSLTCEQAERAISLQLDGSLPRSERGSLRAHLRECSDCARLARGMRGQRSAMRKWGLVPLPGSLFAASQASAATGVAVLGGGSVAAKIAVAAVTATVVVGGGVTIEHRMSAPEPRSPAKEAPAGTHGSDGSAVVPVSATAAPRAAGVAISPVRRRVKAHGAPAPVRVRVRAKKTKKPHRGRDGVTSGQARPKEQGRARPVSPAASKPAKVKPVKAAKPAKTKPVRSKPVKVQPVRVKPVKRPSPPKLVKPRVPPAPPPVAAAPATQESSGSDDDRGKSKGDDGQHGDDGSSGRSKDG